MNLLDTLRKTLARLARSDDAIWPLLALVFSGPLIILTFVLVAAVIFGFIGLATNLLSAVGVGLLVLGGVLFVRRRAARTAFMVLALGVALLLFGYITDLSIGDALSAVGGER